MADRLLIVDFGSQVTQLIARRVRDAGVFSEVFPYDVSDQFVRDYGAAGVILLSREADPYHPAAVRASMGSLFSQRFVRATLPELIAWKQRHGCMLVGTSPAASTAWPGIRRADTWPSADSTATFGSMPSRPETW